MLKKILVPLDGSKLAESILARVDRILYATDAVVTLIAVLPEVRAGSDAGPWRKAEREAEAYLAQLVSALEKKGARAVSQQLYGDPAEKILQAAEDGKSSLIAMSTHGRTGFARWVRGSVAERVLREARCPLLLTNPLDLDNQLRSSSEGFRKILVPLDGSARSAKILPLVKEFARFYDSGVTILCTIGNYPAAAVPQTMAVVYPDVLPTESMIKEELEPYRREIVAAKIPVEVRVQFGLPSEDILKVAEQEQSDLIAMTTHGRSGFSRWAFGSVAEQVIRHCRVPLLVSRAT